MSDPTFDKISAATLQILRDDIVFYNFFQDSNLVEYLKGPLALKRLMNMGVSMARAKEIVDKMKQSGIDVGETKRAESLECRLGIVEPFIYAKPDKNTPK